MTKYIKFSTGETVAINEIATIQRSSSTTTEIYMKGAGRIVDAAGTDYVVAGYLAVAHADDSSAATDVITAIENAIKQALETKWTNNIIVDVEPSVAVSSVTVA